MATSRTIRTVPGVRRRAPTRGAGLRRARSRSGDWGRVAVDLRDQPFVTSRRDDRKMKTVTIRHRIVSSSAIEAP